MRTPTFQSLVLALVLVFGQWASFAHAGKHPALSSAADQTCEFCVHAQGLGAGIAALPALSAPHFDHETPAALATSLITVAAPSHYAIRGPPALFA